jgi:Zn-dependent M16 (insulinase) family peptidase
MVIHGDMSDGELRELFELIEEKVSGFERSEFEPYIAKHTTIPSHRSVDLEFPADPKKKAGEPLALVAWPLGQITDASERVLWDVLEGVLLNGEAAPLRQGLIQRGLAASLVMSGTVMSTADCVFLVGGTDVPRENPKRLAEGVREILEGIVREGISPKAIEAVLNEYSFQLQEGPLSSPQGVQLAANISPRWLRGEDPIAAMDARARLNAARERLTLEPNLLTDLIRDRILNNPESVTVTLKPSHDAHRVAAEQEVARARAYVAELGQEGIDRVSEINTRVIAEMDDPTQLAKIPALSVTDLPPSLAPFDIISERDEHGPIYRGTIPSTGIVYSRLAFDLTDVPDQLLMYAPFLSGFLGNHDTSRPLVEYEQDVRSRTGGISFGVNLDLAPSTNQERINLIARGAALNERSPDLFELTREGLFETRIDPIRARELLNEEISSQELGLQRNGHSAAVGEAKKAVSELYHRGSLLGGFQQLEFLRQLRGRLDSDWSRIHADLTQLTSACITADNARAGLHSDAASRDKHTALLERLLSEIPSGVALAPHQPGIFIPGDPLLGLPVNTDVAYIGTAQRLPLDPNSDLLGAMLVLNRALRYNYLLPEIRGKSGAYGTGASFATQSGIFSTYTYRSKKENLLTDIETIRRIPTFLRSMDLPSSELGKLIIGTASDFAQYEHPRYAASGDFQSRLMGRTRELQERIYQQIVRCTPEQVRQAAEIICNASTAPCVRVVSSESVLHQAGIPISTDRS